MQYVIGYDQGLAAQFFRRSVEDVMDQFPRYRVIAPPEVDYLAGKFSFTNTGFINAEGSPVYPGTLRQLVELSGAFPDIREVMTQAEISANAWLFNLGLVCLGDCHLKPRGHILAQPEMVAQLYYNTAQATFRTSEEAAILAKIGELTIPWISLLRILPRRDLVEVLNENSRLLTVWD